MKTIRDGVTMRLQCIPPAVVGVWGRFYILDHEL
jgi:hypothetical protein